MISPLLPLTISLLAAPLTLVAGRIDHRLASLLAPLFAAASFVALLVGWLSGGASVILPWAPSRDLQFAIELDGLAALYGMLASGIGSLVLAYSSAYVPLHLRHQQRSQEESVRFGFLVLLFMGSMVGLAMSQDLILLFLFWDLTAIASYFLIAYDHESEEARASALMALMVTGVTAVLLLVAALLLHSSYGTFYLPELAERVEPGPLLTSAAFLIAVAGLAKSAQVPFHFWLPRAMAAPTPVSAYLHSAAMVAAGVFLLARTYPLLSHSQALLDTLLVVGLLSIAYGGVIALTRNALKQVLAYSTIAQYGYVLFFYGLGGPLGAAGAAFYVIAHALAKSALFLTAGTVTEATGRKNLDELGGLARRMPLLATASGIAVATLVSLPITIGFFKDEFLFAAVLERGRVFAILAVLAAASTVSYAWRFWSGIFLGEVRAEPGRVPRRLVLPIVVLAGVALLGGINAAPFAALATAAGNVTLGARTVLDATYHATLLPEYLMAAAAFGLGAVIVASRRLWLPFARGLARLDRDFGAERAYSAGLHAINVVSDALHYFEVRRLRSRVGSVLVPTAVLVVVALFETGTTAPFVTGELLRRDVPIVAALVVAAVGAVAVARTKRHLALVAVMSGTGFSLATIYAFWGAPNVALVAVLIETMLTLVLVSAIALVPRRVLDSQARRPSSKRAVLIAVFTALVVFPTAWGAISYVPIGAVVSDAYFELAPLAHARNVVSAILADFRGLDTLGEITVVGLALLGIGSLCADIAPRQVERYSEQMLAGGRARTGPYRTVTQVIARLLYLPILMIAAAILVKGFIDTGDGFAAGMVAALAVLLRYLAFGYRETKRLLVVRHARVVAFIGLLLALATAFVPVLMGAPPLTHWPPGGQAPLHFGTIELMTAVLFDVGVFILVLGFAVGAVANLTRVAYRDLRRGEEM